MRWLIGGLLALLMVDGPAQGQDRACADWQYASCFTKMCAKGATNEEMTTCVAFIHGLISGALQQAATTKTRTGVCVPEGVGSRFIAEGAAARMAGATARGEYEIYSAPGIFAFIKSTWPCR